MRKLVTGKSFWIMVAVSAAALGCGTAADDAETVNAVEQGATFINGRDWPSSGGVVTVPYEIDANIPTFAQDNFLPAVNYIQDATGQRFVFKKRTTESQYLRFRAGSSFDSATASCGVGNNGGVQSCTFRLPQVVGIAHLRDGSANPLRVYFADGTMRATELSDLEPKGSENVAVTFPTNPDTGEPYRAGDVAGIGWSGYMIVWYTNGYVSKGSETDLGSISAPRRFTGYTYQANIGVGTVTVKLKLAAVTISPRGIAHAYWLDPRNTGVGAGPAVRHTQGSSSTNLVGAAADDFLMNVPHSLSEDIVAMVFDEQTHLHSYFQDYGLHTEGTNTDYAQFLNNGSIQTLPHAGFNTVLHELGHAMGFYHEQQRPDRDSYVVVNGTGNNWDTVSSAGTLGGYDFASIMQYDSTPGTLSRVDGSQFSKNYNAFSWRDLRALLVDHGLEDPQASIDAEARAAADLVTASARAGTGRVYSVAAGRIYSDVVAVDWDGSGNMRAYYLHAPTLGSLQPTKLTTSIGTEYDLARNQSGSEETNVTLPAFGNTQISPYDIVGMAISDGSALTYFKSNSAPCASHLFWSRGSVTSLASIRAPECVSLPAGYTADRIREISRYRYGGVTRILTVYDDGTYSVGVTNSLASVSGGTFELPQDSSFTLPNPAHILGFTLNGRNASFFLGCEDPNTTCQRDEYRVVTITDFVSHLPAQYQ